VKPSRPLPFLVFALFLAACGPAGLAQYLVPPGGVLFQDDFSDASSGWGGLDADAGVALYSQGAYRMVVKMPGVNLWAYPGFDFRAARLEADVSLAGGPPENRMGLICRRVDNANFYFFVISGDGYYAIGKVKDGQASLLGAAQMQAHSAIKTGPETNRLRADCIAELLIFYANDQLLGTAQDADFASGDVGILAGTFSVPGADVIFDNFVVYKP
jgi:hypothetical protein